MLGGTTGYYTGSCLNSVNRFELATNQFSVAPNLNERRRDLGSLEFDGCIYAIGGHCGKGEEVLASIERLNVLAKAD